MLLSNHLRLAAPILEQLSAQFAALEPKKGFELGFESRVLPRGMVMDIVITRYEWGALRQSGLQAADARVLNTFRWTVYFQDLAAPGLDDRFEAYAWIMSSGQPERDLDAIASMIMAEIKAVIANSEDCSPVSR